MSQRLALFLFCILGVTAFVSECFVSAGTDVEACASGGASCYEAGYAGLTPLQRQGRDTWYLWTGGETDAHGNVVGDQELWRLLAVRSHGTVDLLQAVDSRYRAERFKRFGVINDPDCTPATAPDQYGLLLRNITPQET